jgi:DNA-binding MarR family transcriptional regulator
VGSVAAVTAGTPLSTLLSQVLVAFTIEFDNEFEHHMPHTTTRGPAAHTRGGPWLVSMPMWVNFLRFVDQDGTPLRDLRDAERLTNLPGLRRWGYVDIRPDRADNRPNPPPGDHLVHLTRHGRRAREVWQPLADTIETRWRDRFGTDTTTALGDALATLTSRFTLDLPHCLPVAGMRRLDHAVWPRVDPGGVTPGLAAMLSQAVLAFTIDFERESRLSLAVSATGLRVLTEDGVLVRDLPALTGVSREAVSGAVKFLQRTDCAEVTPHPTIARAMLVRLTPKGQAAAAKYRWLLAETERDWRTRFGAAEIDSLRDALGSVLDQHDGLSQGLAPRPEGWRAHPPYANLTAALVRDPAAALPHHPLVSHRGGFPDGS